MIDWIKVILVISLIIAELTLHWSDLAKMYTQHRAFLSFLSEMVDTSMSLDNMIHISYIYHIFIDKYTQIMSLVIVSVPTSDPK